MFFTMSLASDDGDHLPAEPDALLAWTSIGVFTLCLFLFCLSYGSKRIDGEGGFLAVAWSFAHLVHRKQTDHFFPRQHALAGRLAAIFRAAVISAQTKGAPACAGAPQRS